jgi:hypothetical protein
MPKKKADKLTAEQAAEKAYPNWKAIKPVVSDKKLAAESDETTPELEQLKRKYLGDAAAQDSKTLQKPKGKAKDLKMVVMESKTPSDTRAGRKTVLVDEEGEIIGEQG